MSRNKKVLIISYYWPPAGGPGVQRWLKFVKYLPKFDWNPTVFVPENPDYPLVDESLLLEVPKETDVIKTKIWEPYQLAEKLNKSNKKYKAGQFDTSDNQNWKSKLSIWIRGNFFIPDARIFWVKPSIRFLEKYLSKNPVNVLVTTGPPHSMHLIGLALKKKYPEMEWVADFRDPWTEISYYKHLKLTKYADRKHRRLEKSIFKNADIILATSYTDAKNFKKAGANAFCITNGYDGNSKEATRSIKNTKFTISYIGVLEQLRNPEILWNTLEELYLADSDFKNNFQLRFVGKVDPNILSQLRNLSFKKNILEVGYVQHQQSLEEMNTADLLLLTNFNDKNSAGIIPGKLFEYLQSGNPILSLGPKNSDVKKILDETNAGQHFTHDEAEPLKQYIVEKWRAWNNDQVIINNVDISAFSRENLTKRLSELLS